MGWSQLGKTFYARLALEHEVKREMLVEALRAAGMTPHVPDGAYYILASTEAGGFAGRRRRRRRLGLCWRRREWRRWRGRRSLSPGSGRGEDLLRFCFAKKDEDLAEACRRLAALGS